MEIGVSASVPNKVVELWQSKSDWWKCYHAARLIAEKNEQ